jgi:hypothetical protein
MFSCLSPKPDLLENQSFYEYHLSNSKEVSSCRIFFDYMGFGENNSVIVYFMDYDREILKRESFSFSNVENFNKFEREVFINMYSVVYLRFQVFGNAKIKDYTYEY